MFVGRQKELGILEQLYQAKSGKLVAIYGRRRIGKSELIHHFLKDKKHLYIDGLEGEHTPAQIKNFISQVANQTGNSYLLKTKFDDWSSVFTYLTEQIFKGNEKYVLALDEVQWMAAGQSKLINQIKTIWDKTWRRQGVFLILCGSVAHFMVKKIIRSKALYGRIDQEMLLTGLSPSELRKLLPNKSDEEVIRYCLIFNGVPKYYEIIDKKTSFEKNLNRFCYTKDSFFVSEVDRIFYSQFKEHKTYKKIAEALSTRSLSQEVLSKKLKYRSGGSFKSFLENLEISGFIRGFRNVFTQSKKDQQYKLTDSYLMFYYSQIQPYENIISNNLSRDLYTRLIKNKINPWLGIAFENFCINNTDLIARALDIEDQVKYVGPYFSKEESCQFDLIFVRTDNAISLCEIKYQTAPISGHIIREFNSKLMKFKSIKGYSIEKVLISISGADQSVIESGYFERILTAKDFFI